MEKRRPSWIADGNISWYRHYGDNMEISLKTKNRAVIWSSNPNSGHIYGQNYNSKDACTPMSIAGLLE